MSVRRRPRGMVLIAVLWIVAALSLLVSGMARTVRSEAQVQSQARLRAVAGGVGDAALHLVLQQLVASAQPPAAMVFVDVVYRGTQVRVQVMPLNGLIDLNTAAAPLLAQMYVVAGGLPRQAAEALAQATVDFRSRRTAQGEAARFEAPEDLMGVPGVGYELYARLSRLVTAGGRGSGRVNPMAAPVEVLTVLAGGNAAVAARIGAQRDAGQAGVDTTALEAGFIDSSAGRLFRLDARVPLADGAWLHVVRSISLNGSDRDGLPWRTFQLDSGFEAVPRKTS